MNKEMLYLAGPMTPNWREGVIKELEQFFIIYDPTRDSRQDCQMHYTSDDVAAAQSARYALGYQPADKKPCLAMAVEMTLCFANKGTVVYVDETPTPDPLLIGIAKRSFSRLEEAINFLKRCATEKKTEYKMSYTP